MLAKFTGLFIAVLPVLAPLNADLIYSNDLTTEYTSLAYSNSFSSNGNNWQRQSGAQRIVLGESQQLSGLRWWGAMDNFFQTGNQNLAGFEIVLWNEDLSQQVVNKTLSIAEVKANETGQGNMNGEIYEFFSDFNYYVTSGTYYLNIGALYYAVNDDDPWDGSGVDQWVWAAGENNMYNQGSAENMDNFLVTSNYPHTGWGVWSPTPLNIGSLTFKGGASRIYAVPEAGSVTLLATAFIFGRRRRR